MTLFQQVGLALIIFVVFIIGAAGARGQVRKRAATFWVLVWLAGGFALVWPNSLVLLALALGIGRGADLLLYIAVLATTWGFFWMFTRVRRLDRYITLLVRELAIASAQMPEREASEVEGSENGPSTKTGRGHR